MTRVGVLAIVGVGSFLLHMVQSGYWYFRWMPRPSRAQDAVLDGVWIAAYVAVGVYYHLPLLYVVALVLCALLVVKVTKLRRSRQ